VILELLQIKGLKGFFLEIYLQNLQNLWHNFLKLPQIKGLKGFSEIYLWESAESVA
jgi:hypothetical protein